MAKRQSIVLQPMALGGLVDFDDSDYESDEDQSPPPPLAPTPQKAGTGSGGMNHRPLVGGFSAAAYEAARAHHYAAQQAKAKKKQNGLPKVSEGSSRLH